MKKLILVFLIMTQGLLFSGCWDKIEIEDRSFILVIGVDKAEKDGEDGSGRFLLSFVHPDIAKEEEGKVNKFITFDVTSDSFITGISEVLQRFPRAHSYEHTKAIILGKELLEDEDLFKETIDFFNRGHEFHTSMLVYAAKERAEDIFKVKPKMEILLGYYIQGISENDKFAARIGRLTFVDFMKQVYEGEGDLALPVLDASKDEILSSNVNIMKDYKYAGHLDNIETVALKWLNNRAKGGAIDFKKDNYSIPLIYHTFKTKIHLDKVEGGKIYLVYKMETEGIVEESTHGVTLLDKDFIFALEKEYERIIQSRCEETIKKIQKVYKVDILGVRRYLYKYHPRLYDSVSKDFQDQFENKIDIRVEIDVKVRRIGKTK